MSLNKKILFALTVILTSAVFAKNYYIKQMISADADGDSKLDTTYQESYISDDLVVTADSFSKSYIDKESFSFYNMTDSTYFTRTFKELEELMQSSDSQVKEFSLKSTGEKKVIGPWETEKYLAEAMIMGMAMDLDMYIAKDTGFPADLMIRQQGKMHENSKNIKDMMEKLKNTGGIVVKEVARIGGTLVSEKEIVSIKELGKLDKKITGRPQGFKLMEQ